MKAVLLISHGSRSSKTKEEVAKLVKQLKERSGLEIFEFAFLECEQPSIPEGIETCIAQGATRVIVLLNFLNSGRHVDEDIPNIVHETRNKHPEVEMIITEPVGQHQRIAELFLDLIPS